MTGQSSWEATLCVLIHPYSLCIPGLWQTDGDTSVSDRDCLHMQAVWRNYVQAMQQAGFSAGVGVYVASGLLTYGASQGAPLLAPEDLPTTACLLVQSHQRVSPCNAKVSDACMPHMP